MAKRIGIIGGTGVYRGLPLVEKEEKLVLTPYGEVNVQLGSFHGKAVAFLQRHGQGHAVPPHQVNYRANIYALKSLGVRQVIATTAVGSLKSDVQPGSFVLCNQQLDFTKNRHYTFFDGDRQPGVVHIDFTHPYCPRLRQRILTAARKARIGLTDGGTYICAEGPRFETAAEVRLFSQLGGSVVGMTGAPETALAREAGICYVGISLVTNFGAGLMNSPLTHAEVVEAMDKLGEQLNVLLAAGLVEVDETSNCTCNDNWHLLTVEGE